MAAREDGTCRSVFASSFASAVALALAFACAGEDNAGQTTGVVDGGGATGGSANGGSSGSSSNSGGSAAASGRGGAGASANGGAANGGATSGGSGNGGATSTGGSSGAPDAGGDTFGPFAGGAKYYEKFSHGPPSDPSFFPITVWLQSPSRAAEYAAIGINTYVGLYQGPTDQMLTTLAAANMPVACDQNSVGLAHVDDATIVAGTQQDEPDNAQPQLTPGGPYQPCVPASTVQNLYATMKSNDSTRPVFLNLGQGVAHDYIGWGSECAQTHPGDYPDYCQGADIVSFDIYPMNETAQDVAGKLWVVADGVDNLMRWTSGQKPVWNWIECTAIDADPSHKPTPEQVKAEVWMSIVHGSMGIGYFVHQIGPPFVEYAVLNDAPMKTAVTAINQQIKDLAPVLNTPPVTNGGTVSSSDSNVPIDMLLKRNGGKTYIFAVAMRGTGARATFSNLTRIPASATATVLGENRQITISGSAFSDDFSGWGVHLYEIQ
jgi:hypothetical protein